MKNSFFNRFVPKQPSFFLMLKQLAEVLSEAAGLLSESMVHDCPEDRASYCRRIKDIEHKGDQLTHKILDELETTFITPLDREDLNSLASSMDDMIDGINSCAKRIHIYNPRSLGEGAKELCGFIVKEASYISKSVDELEAFRKNPLALREYCAELDEVENQADDVYDFFVKKLFEEEMDCIELIKVKEILQEMDRAIDAAANVGKILENVIVKYA